jgi:O-antigen/teichoic acid export membrane protein
MNPPIMADEQPLTPSAATPPMLTRLVKNFGWLGAQKIFVMLVGIAASGIVARHLGPADLGLLGAAQALVAMFGAVALGVDGTVFADELHAHPEQEKSIMGGSTAVLAVIGLMSWLVLVFYTWLVEGADMMFLTVTAVCGLRLLMTFPAPVAMWFQARMHVGDMVVPNTVGTVVLRVWQGLCCWLKTGPLSLAVAEFVSLVSIMLLSWRGYARHGQRVRDWRVDWRTGWRILARSLPAMLAGTLAVLLFRMDVTLLRWLRGGAEVGYYTAASTLTESMLFLGGMTTTVLTPVLLRARGAGEDSFVRAKNAHMRLCAAAAWGTALTLSLGAPWLVRIVYGAGYVSSTAVLAVQAFLLVPGILGAAVQCHLTLEKRLRRLAVCLVLAMAVNALGCVWLIPAHGGPGAAFAAVLAAFTAHVFGPLLFADTRETGLRALRALCLPWPEWRLFKQLS